jgi:hypothetical protein
MEEGTAIAKHDRTAGSILQYLGLIKSQAVLLQKSLSSNELFILGLSLLRAQLSRSCSFFRGAVETKLSSRPMFIVSRPHSAAG